MGKFVQALLTRSGDTAALLTRRRENETVIQGAAATTKPMGNVILGAATRGLVGREMRVVVGPGTRPKARALKPTTATTTTGDNDNEFVDLFDAALVWEEAAGKPMRKWRHLLRGPRYTRDNDNEFVEFFDAALVREEAAGKPMRKWRHLLCGP